MRKILLIANSKHQTARGFTLIELLIVIAIIGVLMTLATINFIGVRERARDAERKSDLVQLQTALEMYRTDIGQYPASLPACDTQFTSQTTPLIIYLRKSPCDPLNTTTRYQYSPSTVNGLRTGYTLFACLENDNDGDSSPYPGVGTRCATGRVHFVVNNP